MANLKLSEEILPHILNLKQTSLLDIVILSIFEIKIYCMSSNRTIIVICNINAQKL